MNHTGFPNTDAFHYSYQKKSHLVITNLTSKIFKCWYAIKLTVKDTSFPKFQFSLESLNSVMDNKHCQSLFTKWRAHSIPLCEHVCQLRGLKKRSSCITGSLKLKWCFMAGGRGLVWLTVQSYECFSSKQPPPSPCAPEALLCIRSVLSPIFLKKRDAQRLKLSRPNRL